MNKTAMIGACCVLAACSTSNTTDQRSESFSIQFAAEANNVAMNCATVLTGMGSANSNATLRDLRFYVHDVQLIDGQDNSYPLTLESKDWQGQGVALLDFVERGENCAGDTKQTHTAITGTADIPASASVQGLAFTLGVPSALNHADRLAAAAPLDRASLHWNWQNGYKHMRIDVAPDGGVSRPSDAGFSSTAWNFHLGSTDCAGNPQLGESVSCGRPNRVRVELDDFDPALQVIVLDYEALVAARDLGQDEAGAPGCMSGASDPECASLFNALGMDVDTGEADPLVNQTVFRVR